MKMTTLVFISLLAFFLFTFLELGSAVGVKKSVVPIEIDHEAEIRDALSHSNLDPFVVELIVAQSKHESGNYKNNLTKYHNVFGRHYHKTDTLAVSAGARAEGHSNFAIYPSLKYATISQINYLKRKKYSFKWKSAKQYAIELKSKGYYEAAVEDYTAALQSHIKK